MRQTNPEISHLPARPEAVRIARLTPQDQPRLSHLKVLPEQEKYSGTVAEAFCEDPARFDLHGIFETDRPVGLFKIDRFYWQSIPVCAPNALGLRAFMITVSEQGRGIATEAVWYLRSYMAKEYPDRNTIDLTVNQVNMAARTCYLKGGFRDTGMDWCGGRAGPQDLFRLVFRK